MAVGLLISLPEGLEAFLIIAVLAAFFHHAGQKAAKAGVVAASGLAVIASISLTAASFIRVDSPLLQWLQLVPAMVGLVIITWLVVKLGRTPTPKIESFIGLGAAVVMLLSFLVVLREVVEASVFTAEVVASASGAELLSGMVLGLVLGAALAMAAYWLLRSFSPGGFQVIGSVLLIFAAAALGAHVATDLGKVGLLPPALAKVAWDVNWIIPQNTFLGRLLHAFTGYNATPNIPAVVFYLSYLLIMGLFLWLVHMPEAAEPAHADATEQTWGHDTNSATTKN